MKKDKIKYFQDEVVRWMELFGLGRWSIKWVEWVDAVEDSRGSIEGADAAANTNHISRNVRMAVNPVKLEGKSEQWISRTALHEVTHVLTARLEDFAASEDVINNETIEEEVEAIAKAMEHVFFGMVDM